MSVVAVGFKATIMVLLVHGRSGIAPSVQGVLGPGIVIYFFVSIMSQRERERERESCLMYINWASSRQNLSSGFPTK